MQKENHEPKEKMPVLRLEPEKRLCPIFDSESVEEFQTGKPEEMGCRVLDHFCEEHIQ